MPGAIRERMKDGIKVGERIKNIKNMKKETRELWLKSVLMGLLPLVCCMVYCAARGKTIGQIYLPASEWNDELFYFKQVEGMVRYGYPYGFFGFNESHAMKLSFAAWSPVLVFPWILWGICLGWNMMSPIYCNIALMMGAMVCFVGLARPTWKQLGILTLLFSLFTPFTRYMLSGMPECICFSLIICFYSLSVAYSERSGRSILVLLFAVAGILTLMRPYMLLFLLLPSFWAIQKSRLWGTVWSGGWTAFILAVYALIKHYLGAAYFTPLFYTEWITTFFHKGVLAGLKYMAWKLWTAGAAFAEITRQGIEERNWVGQFFAGFLVVMVLLVIQAVSEWRGKRKKEALLTGHMAFCFVGMLAALLLMYKMEEGSKHLLTFTAAGIFVISRMPTRVFKKAMAAGAAFAWLYAGGGTAPYAYQAPFYEESRAAEVDQWREIFADRIRLETEQTPSFDNVVIWLFQDRVGGETVLTDWQLLYGLPEGTGISCCMKDYVEEHLDELRSRYLAVPAGGEIDELCAGRGLREIGRSDSLAVYATR